MSTLNKIIAGIFVILLVVIGGEVVYFLTLSQKQKTPPNQAAVLNGTQQTPTRPQNNTKLTSRFSKLALMPEDQLPKEIMPQEAYDRMLDGMKKKYKLIPSKVLRSSIVSDEYVGTIDKIGRENRSVDKLGKIFTGNVFLTLKVGEKDIYTLIWTDDEVRQSRFVSSKNGVETPITFNDLKQGDKVTIKISVDIISLVDKNFRENLVIRWE